MGEERAVNAGDSREAETCPKYSSEYLDIDTTVSTLTLSIVPDLSLWGGWIREAVWNSERSIGLGSDLV